MRQSTTNILSMPLPRQENSSRGRKSVPARQSAIDSLPLGSGDWTVDGVPGLVIRCGARTKSFRLQRRVNGKLAQRVLGEMSLAAARRLAMKTWAQLKPAPPDGRMTWGEAWARYLEEKPLAEKTRQLYEYNLKHYLANWSGRTLEHICADRAGVRSLYLQLVREHGIATGQQVMQMLSAVYHYCRRVNLDLPPNPTEVVDMRPCKPRDWALPEQDLMAWWEAVERLKPLKRTWWLVVLLTGARMASVSHLRWEDVDFDQGILHFRVAKAGRSYSVPMSRRLASLLKKWREQAPPSEWVFESPVLPGRPLQGQVRDDKRGVASAHHLRHTFRTVLAQLGCPPDGARLLPGHSLSGDVSRGYITARLVVDSLRPWAEKVADYYARVMRWRGS